MTLRSPESPAAQQQAAAVAPLVRTSYHRFQTSKLSLKGIDDTEIGFTCRSAEESLGSLVPKIRLRELRPELMSPAAQQQARPVVLVI
jgi:hypothetical protein